MTGALTSLLTGRIGYLQAMQYAEAAAALTDAQCSRVEQLTLDKAESRNPVAAAANCCARRSPGSAPRTSAAAGKRPAGPASGCP